MESCKMIMYWLFNLVLYRDMGQSDRSYWSDYQEDVKYFQSRYME